MKTQKTTIKPEQLLGLTFDGSMGTIPISQNHNDKNTQFAGSMFSGAILTAYHEIRSWFAEQKIVGELVAKSTEMKFLAPVYSNAQTKLVDRSDAIQKTNGNYELQCTVHVLDEKEHKCAVLKVSFVFVSKQPDITD